MKGDLRRGLFRVWRVETPRLQRVITSSVIHKVSEQEKGDMGMGREGELGVFWCCDLEFGSHHHGCV